MQQRWKRAENKIQSFFSAAAAFAFFLRAAFRTLFRMWWVIRGAMGPSRLGRTMRLLQVIQID